MVSDLIAWIKRILYILVILIVINAAAGGAIFASVWHDLTTFFDSAKTTTGVHVPGHP